MSKRKDHLGQEYNSFKEMAEAWNIPYELFRGRRKYKWDLKRILTEPVNDRNRKSCTDHLGNRYPSITTMSEAYGLPPGTLKARLQTYGWDLEQALTTPVAKRKTTRQSSYQDHKGNEYPTLKALCEAYGIQPHIYYNRHQLYGWDLEKTLTTPVPSLTVTDHLGNKFPSMEAMARAYGINSNALRTRLKSGWDTESALTLPVGSKHITRDHKGNEFPTKTAMAEAYGLSFNILRTRLRLNWDLESALTTPIGESMKLSPRMCRDHNGKIYSTQKAMAEAYGITYQLLFERQAAGWSKEKALTTPIGKRNTPRCYQCKDHLGKKYPSKKAMAEAYGLTYRQLIKRLEANWTLEEALTAGHKELMHFQGGCKDHKGNRYPSKAAMAKAYGIPESAFRRRISRGWSLETALTTPIYKNDTGTED